MGKLNILDKICSLAIGQVLQNNMPALGLTLARCIAESDTTQTCTGWGHYYASHSEIALHSMPPSIRHMFDCSKVANSLRSMQEVDGFVVEPLHTTLFETSQQPQLIRDLSLCTKYVSLLS